MYLNWIELPTCFGFHLIGRLGRTQRGEYCATVYVSGEPAYHTGLYAEPIGAHSEAQAWVDDKYRVDSPTAR